MFPQKVQAAYNTAAECIVGLVAESNELREGCADARYLSIPTRLLNLPRAYFLARPTDTR